MHGLIPLILFLMHPICTPEISQIDHIATYENYSCPKPLALKKSMTTNTTTIEPNGDKTFLTAGLITTCTIIAVLLAILIWQCKKIQALKNDVLQATSPQAFEMPQVIIEKPPRPDSPCPLNYEVKETGPERGKLSSLRVKTRQDGPHVDLEELKVAWPAPDQQKITLKTEFEPLNFETFLSKVEEYRKYHWFTF